MFGSEVLPHINKWINRVPHESAGLSPFEIHFGKKPPADFPLLERLATHSVLNYEERCRIVYANLNRAAEKREKMVKRPHEFKVGDRVLLRTPASSDAPRGLFAKFFPLFAGPFTIRGNPHPNVFELVTDDRQPAGKYNAFNLIPFRE